MKRLPIAGLILIASPAIALAILMLRYGVDVPFWDQWWVIALSEALHLHVLTFSQLFAQLNEHRLFFPRVIILAINALSHGNVKWDLAALWLLAAIVLFNVYRLAQKTLEGSAVRLLTTTWLASLLIFSPIQYQNWLWGMQVDMLLPMTCLSTALLALYSSRGPWLKLWIAAALATVAGYSYLNGLSCWVLLIPALLRQFAGRPTKARAFGLWIALAAINLAAFFYQYLFLSTQPRLADLASHAELVAMSFLAFLGSPLAFGTLIDEERLAHLIGFAVVILAGAVCLRFLNLRKQPGIVWRCLPWLTIGAYGLATAVIVTIGRATSSPARLLESRYTSFSIYVLIALVFLWPILFQGPAAAPSGWKRWGPESAAILIVLLQFFTSLFAIGRMRESRIDRLESKACLAFINLLDDPCQTQRLDWDSTFLKQRAQSLQRLDYFHPPLLQSPDLRRIAAPAPLTSNQYGVFESLANMGSGFYRASGSALLPDRGEPADAAVLTYLRADGVPVAFAIADWIGASAEWEKWFQLPSGANRIQAWAFDALAGQAFPMSAGKQASSAPLTNIRFVSDARGFLDTGQGTDALPFKGWAVLVNKQKPADQILLTCGDEHSIVATGQPWQPRPDVARELGDARYLKSGWQISLRPGQLPPGCAVQAWAYDAATNKAGLLRDLRPPPH